ncbi:MAG: hypothetical protein U9Q33_04555 [Campylobacterota bacterium]|nr:hypothetical protein [Campylobacterota bacterium]
MHYDDDYILQKIFLVHINKEIISNILKKVRECEQKSKDVNKSRISIKYDESNALTSTTDKSVKDKIKDFIPYGMSDYINKKDEILKNIGFEKYSIRFNIEFESNITQNDLIDFSLGIKPIAIKKIDNIMETRFSIELPSKIKEFEDAKNIKMLIKHNKPKAKLFIKENCFSNPLIFELYSTITNVCLIDKNIMLLENDLLSFKIDFDEANHEINISYEYDKKYNFKELFNIFELINLANKTKGQLFFELYIGDIIDKKPIQISFNNNEIELHLYSIFNKFSKILHCIEISDEIKITIQDIDNIKEQIQNIYDLLFLDLEKININYELKTYKNSNNTKEALIVPVSIIVDKYIIGTVLILTGDIIYDESNQYKLIIKSRKNIHNFKIEEKEFNFELLKDIVYKSYDYCNEEKKQILPVIFTKYVVSNDMILNVINSISGYFNIDSKNHQ